MSDTFTAEQRAKLEDYLANHILPSGLGSEESACSIAAINLAINGELKDNIPPCMSSVLGRATIRLQDAMPDEMRNSDRYKTLLPNMAGTGRDNEPERLGFLMDWMWSTVLPQLQPLADEKGFGAEWSDMCRLKTDEAADAANAAANAADAKASASDYAYAGAADAAYAAANAADAAAADAYVAVYASTSAVYAVYASTSANADTFWNTVDPIGVLERMTYLKTGKQP
jgi:hypothetical protein